MNASTHITKPFVGAKALLLAVGFNPTSDNMSLKLDDEADMDNLRLAKQKIEDGLTVYNK